jgi:predicted aconitase with swiveling domain/ADP-ribose pyrophosphatase YjhB (NUDIX family)
VILKGRGLSKGKGEAEVIATREPVSFLGGVDPETGKIIDENSDIFGESIGGKVFAFPEGKGSTVGSYVIYGLALNGCAPVAILNEKSEVVVATGVIISGIPLVDEVDIKLLRTGDRVEVNGEDGKVDIKGLKETHVVTSFMENDGEILILKRSELVGAYQGLWAGVSGYLEENETPLMRAMKEIEEEIGLEDPRLVIEGEPVMSRDETRIWVIHPYMFHTDSREVTLDWEHTDHRWIRPSSVDEFETVPRLSRTLDSVVHGLTIEMDSRKESLG